MYVTLRPAELQEFIRQDLSWRNYAVVVRERSPLQYVICHIPLYKKRTIIQTGRQPDGQAKLPLNITWSSTRIPHATWHSQTTKQASLETGGFWCLKPDFKLACLPVGSLQYGKSAWYRTNRSLRMHGTICEQVRSKKLNSMCVCMYVCMSVRREGRK